MVLYGTATITDQPFCNCSLFLFSFSSLIVTSLQSYWDEWYLTLSLSLHFYLEKFCPVFIVIACHRFWTDLFAIRRAAELKVRPLNWSHDVDICCSQIPSTISSFRYVLNYYRTFNSAAWQIAKRSVQKPMAGYYNEYWAEFLQIKT